MLTLDAAWVIVASEQGRIEFMPVKRGLSYDDLTVVEGLKPDAWVVIDEHWKHLKQGETVRLDRRPAPTSPSP